MSPSCENNSERKSLSASRRSTPAQLASSRNTPTPLASTCAEVLPARAGGGGDFRSTKVSFSGNSAASSIAQWQIDEFLGLTEFNQGYGYTDNGSSKADSGKHGDSDSLSVLRSSGKDGNDDECLGLVPDSSWAVPQVPSPPTASWLFWPRKFHNQSDGEVNVPECAKSAVLQHHK